MSEGKTTREKVDEAAHSLSMCATCATVVGLTSIFASIHMSNGLAAMASLLTGAFVYGSSRNYADLKRELNTDLVEKMKEAKIGSPPPPAL